MLEMIDEFFLGDESDSNFSIDYDDIYFNDEQEFSCGGEDSVMTLREGKRGKKYRRVERQKCCYSLCDKIGYYREEFGTEYFCKEHRGEEMYDPRRKSCEISSCHKPAFYNFSGCSKKFCKLHKLEGMINVCTHKCCVEGCNTYPSYNFEGQTRRTDRCKTHKLDGMIDVRNPKCIFPGCEKFARFHKKTKCYTHKND